MKPPSLRAFALVSAFAATLTGALYVAHTQASAALIPSQGVSSPLPPLFSPAERAAIVAYWSEPARYTVAAPDAARASGPYQVRLTPEGSVWLLAYQKAVAGAKRLPPTQDAQGAKNGPEAAWETWIAARVARDRWDALRAADAANAAITPAYRWLSAVGDTPLAPGPIPADLLGACGNPPPFANVVAPLSHRVTLDGEAFTFPDNVRLRDRYAYYRFPQGTVAYGPALKDMTRRELAPLFAGAGFTPSEQKVFGAVSQHEGGFETVNTYDTGFVSVGFIQFVTLATGQESLSEVLLQEKADRPAPFERDFRRFGVEVHAGDKTIVAVDAATGAELSGALAVRKIVEDKRFAAVFQRAGRHSSAFRIAQIKVAKAHYWPAAVPIHVTLADKTVLTGAASDVIRSEAGMATLLDRNVNRGTIAPFDEIASQTAQAHHCRTLADLAGYEREIVAPLTYRSDYLADKSLEQPK